MVSSKNSTLTPASTSAPILLVQWESGIETVDVAAILGAVPGENEQITTSEVRTSNGRVVIYTPAHGRVEGNERAFTLTYKDGGKWLSDGQEEGSAEGDHGTATYTKGADEKWTCSWQSAEKKAAPIPVPCDEADPETGRLQRAYMRAVRDPAFRNRIFGATPACAITGESNRVVLEAAHILGVGDAGKDDLNNGLVLRRDLHALFDANIIKLDEDGVFVMDPILEKYSEMFSKENAPRLAADRVAFCKDNIVARNKAIASKAKVLAEKNKR